MGGQEQHVTPLLQENLEQQASAQNSTAAAVCTGKQDATPAQHEQEQSMMQPMAPMGYYIIPMLLMPEQSGTKEGLGSQKATVSSMPRQSERQHTKQSKQAGASRAPLNLSTYV